MGDVLVDTSVWVDYLRRSTNPPWRPVLTGLLDQDAAVIVDPTLTELLFGARGDRDREAIVEIGRSVRRARIDLETWMASGDLGRHWRGRGRSLSLVDCLLATVALRDDLQLWTLDEDFAPLVKDSALRRFSPTS